MIIIHNQVDNILVYQTESKHESKSPDIFNN